MQLLNLKTLGNAKNKSMALDSSNMHSVVETSGSEPTLSDGGIDR